MERYSIEDIDDFITTTPGTFGGSFFGVPGAISIRGGKSETFFHGFKRVLNDGIFPTPIGSAERIEIIRGAVPVIYGAGRVGGLLNFHPKAAQSSETHALDHPEGEVSITLGSYGKKQVSGEYLIPLELGGRDGGLAIYGEYEDSKSFYIGREPQHELLQVDFNQDMGNGWRVKLGGMYYNSSGYLQSPGWNRLTQDLIDNGTYITVSTLTLRTSTVTGN